MSHHIYNTEGIVLSSFPVGEADKLFKIFTRELGLVEAKAQSIRKIQSKNRYGLQDFSVSNFSLVRGRDIWRITNVDALKNIFNDLKNEEVKLNSFSKIIFLVQKLVHGEEKNEELFDILIGSFDFLKKEKIDNRDYKNFELIISLKILDNLGYFNRKSQGEKLIIFLEDDLSKKLLGKMSLVSKYAELEISKALEESHL